jgi:hypothetical protein
VYVVIPAGGSGTRLWPLSRAAYPKFLHPLTGDSRTLIQATIDRLASLAPPERTFVVTGGAHVAAIARQLPDLPAANILVEPSPRDSAAAIGLAAAIIARRDPGALMGSFHADHLVRDEELFRETVRLAERAAREGYLMTIGIAPTAPETGYGYIRWGEALAVAGTFWCNNSRRNRRARSPRAGWPRAATCGTAACSSGAATRCSTSWPGSSPNSTPVWWRSPPPGIRRAARRRWRRSGRPCRRCRSTSP